MPKVTIQNIKNTKTPDGPLELRSASAVTFTGNFTNRDLVVIADGAGTVAGVQYTVRFTLENPHTAQDADQLHVAVDTVKQTTSGREVMTSALAAELAPMKIREPAFVSGTNFTQTSSYPCDNNTITATLISNVPIFAACSPTFTISGLVDTMTSDGRMADAGSSQAFDWMQASGTAMWNVTSDVASNYETAISGAAMSYGYTRMVLAVDVTNQQMGRDGTNVVVEASYMVGTSQAWTPTTQAGANMDELATFLRTPTITQVKMNQSSPYPCDNNTIVIEIYTNVPFFGACSPMVTISKLTGSVQTMFNIVNNTNLGGPVDLPLVDSTTGVARNGSDASSNSMVEWDLDAGTMKFGISDGVQIGDPRLYSNGETYPTLVLKVSLLNQAAPQRAPSVAISARYAAPAQDETAWDIDTTYAVFPFSAPANSEDSATYTGNPVHQWATDAASYKKPLYIREAEFLAANIGQ
ncbi:hypothetical protein T484DRAFT_1776118, partial [Baffinella frigidus]